MPIQIPAFVQYQAPLVPLRGLWNAAPSEGDRFISAELDWLNSPPGNAVQFQLSGNSPVALSQIVALFVDNAGCGADVQFLFPDSASILNVPALSSGVFPVFTNALMFYASAPNSIVGDRTVFQAFNSMPPPVQISESQAQETNNLINVPIANGTSALIPAGVNGTLRGLHISINATGGSAAGYGQIVLQSGTGVDLWVHGFQTQTGQLLNETIDLTGLNLRFVNGLNIVVNVGGTAVPTGTIIANVYYSVP